MTRLGASHVCSTQLAEELSTGPLEKLEFHTGVHSCANIFISFSYGMELRDTGRYGFLLPASYIEPVGIETWEFHKTLAEAVIEKFGSS